MGRVFNIGSDEAVTIRKLAEEIISRVDAKLKIDYLPYRRAYGDDFEDVRRRVPDVTRLYETIGTKPVMTAGGDPRRHHPLEARRAGPSERAAHEVSRRRRVMQASCVGASKNVTRRARMKRSRKESGGRS